ncbi:MAG: tetratricopeptide repeat protein [Fidelibacterota bacterium]
MKVLQAKSSRGCKLLGLSLIALFVAMCVPPQSATEVDEEAAQQAYLDSLREVLCPRKMSSAAEYYKNHDWEATVRVYREIIDLGCDKESPEEVYQFFAIAYEQLGKFDSAEYVLLKGLQLLPDNVDLRKRLAYAYQKQGKVEQQIVEYSRLAEMSPNDLETKIELAKLYKAKGAYEDQIDILRQALEIDPTNDVLQGEIARAYELSGRDPLEIYGERFKNNPDNVSYGLDYAERLIAVERYDEAIDVLKQVLSVDKTSKLAYRKLGQTYIQADRLDEASAAFEELFKLDPRDYNVAIKVSEVNVENRNFGKAFRWVEKAVALSNSGEAYGQKGNVYFKAFQNCRTADVSLDDRIVVTLAYNNFLKAEELGNKRFTRSLQWIKDNEVLFGKAQWFMLDEDQKNKGYLKPTGSCYDWVEEKLLKDPQW